jgi:hypothetical protein
MVLDEEENSSLRKEQTWVKNGLVDVFERYSTEYRGIERELLFTNRREEWQNSRFL